MSVERKQKQPLKKELADFLEGSGGRIIGYSFLCFSLAEAGLVSSKFAVNELNKAEFIPSALIYGTELTIGTASFIARDLIKRKGRKMS